MKLLSRGLAAIGALVLLSDPLLAVTYRLNGEITDGVLPFPPDIIVPAVVVPFPIPYSGVFDYQPLLSLASFEFTPSFPPLTYTVDENLFSAVVQEDAAALVVNFSKPDAFFKTFQLSLDKSTGQGFWQFHQGCLVCDFVTPLPNADATITSYSVIPEPGALALLSLGAVAAVGGMRRFRR
jgi:hypothetical protein